MLERTPEGRRGGPVAAILAAAALVGLGAIAVRRTRERARHAEGNAVSPDAGLRRSLTIMGDAVDLQARWRDPETLKQVLEPALGIETAGGGRARCRLDLPLGQSVEWDMELAERGPGDVVWRSIDGTGLPSLIEATFGPATGGRGTVMTLRLEFAPPFGPAGKAAVGLFAKPIRIAALGALYRFRALVQTGEVPRTSPQPAARNGGSDS